jgi:four helix bundle protein
LGRREYLVPLKTYRDLEVWQKAMDLVVAAYQLTRKFPAEEKFGLSSQLQRAAVSIAASIAEGYGRRHRGDYLYHLSVASGSRAELETHVTIAVRLGFVSRKEAMEVWALSQEVGRMLTKLIQSLEEGGKHTKRTPNPKP